MLIFEIEAVQKRAKSCRSSCKMLWNEYVLAKSQFRYSRIEPSKTRQNCQIRPRIPPRLRRRDAITSAAGSRSRTFRLGAASCAVIVLWVHLRWTKRGFRSFSRRVKMASFSPASNIGSIQHLSEISVLYEADKVLDRFHFRSPDRHRQFCSLCCLSGHCYLHRWLQSYQFQHSWLHGSLWFLCNAAFWLKDLPLPTYFAAFNVC